MELWSYRRVQPFTETRVIAMLFSIGGMSTKHFEGIFWGIHPIPSEAAELHTSPPWLPESYSAHSSNSEQSELTSVVKRTSAGPKWIARCIVFPIGKEDFFPASYVGPFAIADWFFCWSSSSTAPSQALTISDCGITPPDLRRKQHGSGCSWAPLDREGRNHLSSRPISGEKIEISNISTNSK